MRFAPVIVVFRRSIVLRPFPHMEMIWDKPLSVSPLHRGRFRTSRRGRKKGFSSSPEILVNPRLRIRRVGAQVFNKQVKPLSWSR
jgi:hypothetical protein